MRLGAVCVHLLALDVVGMSYRQEVAGERQLLHLIQLVTFVTALKQKLFKHQTLVILDTNKMPKYSLLVPYNACSRRISSPS